MEDFPGEKNRDFFYLDPNRGMGANREIISLDPNRGMSLDKKRE